MSSRPPLRRGEYRSILTVLVDGPDYQALSPAAKLVLLTLKLSLGPAQIGVVPAVEHVLAVRTGLPVADVLVALADLAEWVEREGSVVWVIDGLKYEPSISDHNDGHRQSVNAIANALPRLRIVKRFRARYPSWFLGSGDGKGDGKGDGTPPAISFTETETETETITETEDSHALATSAKDADSKPDSKPAPRDTAPAVQVCQAANAGAQANPLTAADAGLHPLTPDRAQQAVADWLAPGIPLPLICRVVEDVARRYTPAGTTKRRITSFRYFDQAIREAHAAGPLGLVSKPPRGGYDPGAVAVAWAAKVPGAA